MIHQLVSAVVGVLHQHIAGTIVLQLPVCIAVARAVVSYVTAGSAGSGASWKQDGEKTVAAWLQSLPPSAAQSVPADLHSWLARTPMACPA